MRRKTTRHPEVSHDERRDSFKSTTRVELRTLARKQLGLGCTQAKRRLVNSCLKTLNSPRMACTPTQLRAILNGSNRIFNRDGALLLVRMYGCAFVRGGILVSLENFHSARYGQYFQHRMEFDRLQKLIRSTKLALRDAGIDPSDPDFQFRFDIKPRPTFVRELVSSLGLLNRGCRRRAAGAVLVRLQDRVVELQRLMDVIVRSQLNGQHGEFTNGDDLHHGPEHYAVQLVACFFAFVSRRRYSIVVQSEQSCYVADYYPHYFYLAPSVSKILLFSHHLFREASVVEISVWEYPVNTGGEPIYVRRFSNPRMSQIASANGEITESDDVDMTYPLVASIGMFLLVLIARHQNRRQRNTMRSDFGNTRIWAFDQALMEFDVHYEHKPTEYYPQPRPLRHPKMFFWPYQLLLAILTGYVGMGSSLVVNGMVVLNAFVCAKIIHRYIQLNPWPEAFENVQDYETPWDDRPYECGKLVIYIAHYDCCDCFSFAIPLEPAEQIEDYEYFQDIEHCFLPSNTLEVIALYSRIIEMRNITAVVRIQLNGVNGEVTNLDDMQRGRGRGAGRGRGRGFLAQGAAVGAQQLVQAIGQLAAGGNPPMPVPVAIPPPAPAPNPPGHAAQQAYNALPPPLVGPAPAAVMSFASYDPKGQNIVPYNVLPADARTYLQNGRPPGPLIEYTYVSLHDPFKSACILLLFYVLGLLAPRCNCLLPPVPSFISYMYLPVLGYELGRNRDTRPWGPRWVNPSTVALAVFFAVLVYNFLIIEAMAVTLFIVHFAHRDSTDLLDSSGDVHNRPNAYLSAYRSGAFLFRIIVNPALNGPLGNDLRPASHRNSALKYDMALVNASIHCFRHDCKTRQEITIGNVQFDWRWAISNYRYQAAGIDETINASLRAASFDNTGNTDTCRDPAMLAWFYRFVASNAAQFKTTRCLNHLGVGFDPSTCVDTESEIMISN